MSAKWLGMRSPWVLGKVGLHFCSPDLWSLLPLASVCMHCVRVAGGGWGGDSFLLLLLLLVMLMLLRLFVCLCVCVCMCLFIRVRCV